MKIIYCIFILKSHPFMSEDFLIEKRTVAIGGSIEIFYNDTEWFDRGLVLSIHHTCLSEVML